MLETSVAYRLGLFEQECTLDVGLVLTKHKWSSGISHSQIHQYEE